MEQQSTLLDLNFASLTFAEVYDDVKRASAGKPLPSRSLEDGPDDEWIKDQEYSNCDRPQEIVASFLAPLVLRETVSLEDLPLDARVAIVSLRRRRETSIIEAIQTHPELRAALQVNYEEKHLIRDGHIMWLDGITKMSSSLARGEEKAKQDAEENPLMIPLVRRTGADKRFGERAEQLKVGQWLMGPSAYEDSADELFMRSIGWHKGLSFWQAACRLDEDTVKMFSFSVDPIPSEVIRHVWEQKSKHTIPSEITADTWQDFSEVSEGSEEACRQALLELRAECYRETGDTRQRFTVEEIFELNKASAEEIFNKFFMRVILRVKDEVIQGFIKGLLDKPDALNDDVYWPLLSMYNRDHLTRSDANLLEHLLRYAESQHYCRALRAAIASGAAVLREVVVPAFRPTNQSALLAMAGQLSGHVIYGAQKNEILGGCIKLVSIGGGNRRKPKEGAVTLSDLMKELGLEFPHDEAEDEDEDTGERKWAVCRTANCPSHGSDPAKSDKTWCGGCAVCLNDCQPIYDRGAEPNWPPIQAAEKLAIKQSSLALGA